MQSSKESIAHITIAQADRRSEIISDLVPKLDRQTKDIIFAPSTILLLIALGFLGFIYLSGDGNGKNKLANSYWGGEKEIKTARKKALKQLKSPTRNSACLYLNSDSYINQKLKVNWEKQGFKIPWKQIKKEKTKTFYIPDTARGTMVVGAAGTGKTYSVIDPAIRSSLDQGFPTIVYDFKYPAQTERCAAYAAARGYEVIIIAPGMKESYTCNPLEFLRDEEDAVSAGQLSQTIRKNMDTGDGKGGDKFFEAAGNSLVEGIFLLTKAVPRLLAQKYPEEFAQADGKTPNKQAWSFCDLIMSQQILSLDNVAERLFQAKENGVIRTWSTVPLTQVFQSKDSEKTISGIAATASEVFQKFLKKDFIGSFCGDTNFDLDIEGKKLVIFGLDRINRDIVGPLLAAIINMIVNRNVSRREPRKDPLMVFLDEVVSMYLPNLPFWLAENREDGFNGFLAFQNYGQLKKRYGEDMAKVIMANCSTKLIFNPQENDSNKMFSEMLGETEVRFKTRSTSSSKGGGSRSINQQIQKKPLFEPAEFGRLGQGRCVVLNPNYKRKKEAYIPLLRDMQVKKGDILQQEWSVANWEAVRQHVLKQNQNNLSNHEDVAEILTEMIEERRFLAEKLFPLNKAEKAPSAVSQAA